VTMSETVTMTETMTRIEPVRIAETVFGQVSQELQSEHDDDQSFWWGMFGQSLATLLKTAGYNEAGQLENMRWFHRWVPRSLGPRPVNGKPHYPSTMTNDGSPLEYSLNWKEKKPTQLIRFTAEPMSHETGRPVDALNRAAARNLLASMAKEVPGIDLNRFDILMAATQVPEDKMEQVQSQLSPNHLEMRVVCAYDLEDGGLVAKCYINPEPRAVYDSTSTNTVAFDAVSKCDGPHGSYNASAEAVRNYLSSFDGPGAPKIMLMAIDCVADSPKSRIKLYSQSPVTTLASALDRFTLGGRLSGPVIEGGLEAIRSFWCHRFGFDRSNLTTEKLNEECMPAGSWMLFVYEMRPVKHDQKQEPEIEVKMHMPATWLGQTDTEIGQVLSTWFAKNGHSHLASRYLKDLALAL
jgi:DMATS type aromatic prenyltransferase